MLTIVEGDLFEHYAEHDIFLHNCNCHCNWGKGFALAAREHFKKTYIADMGTRKGDPRKLGTISIGHEENGVIGINCYGMYNYGRQHRNFLYANLELSFKRVAMLYPNKRICCPMIGAGYAAGDSADIIGLLKACFPKQDVTVYVLKGTQ